MIYRCPLWTCGDRPCPYSKEPEGSHNGNNRVHMVHGGEVVMSGFDFTFDCPVFLLGSENGGYLLTDDGFLCLWTDADGAVDFVNRSGDGRPYMNGLSLVEIRTDSNLLAFLMEAQQASICEVAVDLASADQTTVRMLHIVDLLDMPRKRIAET